MADDELGAACAPSSRFQVGSVSKQFVAAAVLLLHERQLIALDAAISLYLSEIPADWHSMTIHQLLSHTSGLGHWRDVPDFDILQLPPRVEVLDHIEAMPLASPPGMRWSYSGPGYLLAACLVERVTDTPYSTSITEQIFRPLGMTAATAGSFPTGAGAARGYHAGARAHDARELASIPGTGDVWSTAGDLNCYSERLASGALLSAASVNLLSTSHATTGMTFPPSEWIARDGYGYGCFLGKLGGEPVQFHPGDNPRLPVVGRVASRLGSEHRDAEQRGNVRPGK
jgi:CubicO group peptidase (beta-lactamase class C family)